MADSPASRLLLFVQFPAFLRDWRRLGLDDEALRALERELIETPDKGSVIEHTGGLRKLRFTPPGSVREARRVPSLLRSFPGVRHGRPLRGVWQERT